MSIVSVYGPTPLSGYTMAGGADTTAPIRVGMPFYVKGGETGWEAVGGRIFIQNASGRDYTGAYAYLYRLTQSGNYVMLDRKPFTGITTGWNEIYFDRRPDLEQFPSGQHYMFAVYLPQGGYCFKSAVHPEEIISTVDNRLVASGAGDIAASGWGSGNNMYIPGTVPNPDLWTNGITRTAWLSFNSTSYGLDVLVATPDEPKVSEDVGLLWPDTSIVDGFSQSGETDAVTVGSVFHVEGGTTGWTGKGARIYIKGSATQALTGAWAYLYRVNSPFHTLLAKKALPSPLAKGAWNEVYFDVPVPLDTGYYAVAIYLPTNGFLVGSNHYATETSGFLDRRVKGTASSESPIGNGIFSYGTIADPSNPPAPTFSSSGVSANYGVDPIVGTPGSAPENYVSYYDETVSASPFVYYRMAETVVDTVRDEMHPANTLYNMTYGVGVTPATGAIMYDGNVGASFNGLANEGYALGPTVDLSSPIGTPLTFETWVSIPVGAYASNDAVLAEVGGTWWQGAGTFIINPNNSTGGESNTWSVGFVPRSNTGVALGVHRVTFSRNSILEGSGWHHLKITMVPNSTVASADRVKVTVDGQDVVTTVRESTFVGTGTFGPNASIRLGCRSASSLNMRISLDEVAIWKRDMSTSEALSRYQIGMGTFEVADPPVNSVAPTITGSAKSGSTITCSPGTWSNSPSLSYQWKRGSTNIGSNQSTYLVVDADIGQTITCVVTATNMGGSANATSNSLVGSMAAKLTIAEENALPANITQQQYNMGGAGDPLNQGFCREFSVNVGETANFSVAGDCAEIWILRVGWYGGVGMRRVTTIPNTAASQPEPTVIPNSNNSITCSNWSTTASWTVPLNATPGNYIGLTRNAALNNGSYIPFIVRDDSRPADVMIKGSDATYALAYNFYGPVKSTPFAGKSWYGSTGALAGGIENRGHAMTYHRPIVTRQGVSQSYPMYDEWPLIRFLERNGVDVTYSSCKDWRAGGPSLANCKIYVANGHDEYWDSGMRDKWYALRNQGKKLMFFGGNVVFWRTRTVDDGITYWCYKDTMTGPGAHVAGTALDPVSWTGTWKDTRPANNTYRDPEWNLTGGDFRMNGVLYRTATIPPGGAGAHATFWRDTNVMTNGLTAPDIIGMEADEMRPTQPTEHVATLMSSTVNIDGNRADNNGETYGSAGNLNWGVVLQRFPKNAAVVAFNTCTWAWYLDNMHDSSSGGAQLTRANTSVQQATLNLFADLGAQPTTLMAGLTAPTPQSLNSYALAVPGAEGADYDTLQGERDILSGNSDVLTGERDEL